MVNTPQCPSKEICEEYFAQLLVPQNQPGKATDGQCKLNIWQCKMVPFNTGMTNQYAPD